jgi:hypothetical protein
MGIFSWLSDHSSWMAGRRGEASGEQPARLVMRAGPDTPEVAEIKKAAAADAAALEEEDAAYFPPDAPGKRPDVL